MKKKVLVFVAFLLLGTLFFAHASLAKEKSGVGSTGGGDPAISRKAKITQFIQGPLKHQLELFLQELPTRSGEKNTLIESTLPILNALIEDVRRSPYRIRPECLTAQEKRKAATSIMNQPGGAVCFSPAFLARSNPRPSEIVALALHEHLHHFGFLDANHRLYDQAASILAARLYGCSSQDEKRSTFIDIERDPLIPGWTAARFLQRLHDGAASGHVMELIQLGSIRQDTRDNSEAPFQMVFESKDADRFQLSFEMNGELTSMKGAATYRGELLQGLTCDALPEAF